MTIDTRRTRRPFQFSLRTLLLVMVPAGLVFGWIGWTLQQTRRYERILAQLSEYKPAVVWSYGNPVELHFDDPLANFNLGDDQLALIGELQTLHELTFCHAPNVTDKGLLHLKGMSELVLLDLANTGITDVGLAHLKDVPSLRGLGLRGTVITDAGLGHLSALPVLHSLYLVGSNVTDAGLPVLEKLPAIRQISFGYAGSELTQRGLEEFRRSMPSVDVTQTQHPDVWLEGPRLSSWQPEIILSQVREGCIDMQMVCVLQPGRLDELGLQRKDVQAAAPRMIMAFADQLPERAVDLLRKGLTQPEGEAAIARSADVQELLRAGATVELRFGCAGGGGGTVVRLNTRGG